MVLSPIGGAIGSSAGDVPWRTDFLQGCENISRALKQNDCALIGDQPRLEPHQLGTHQASLQIDAIEIMIQ
jgi:hypothetical protein